MRTYFLALLVLPLSVFGQSKLYFSGDASANFGRHLEWTGYSVNVSGNARLSSKLYAGIATGILQVRPFINHLTVPLSGRLTFFTSSDETAVAPFGMFEYGKLFYRDEGYAGVADYTMEGKNNIFAGVGIRLPSSSRTHSFFAIGYSEFRYDNNQYDHQNTVIVTRPYHFRRVVLKLGLMLSREWRSRKTP
jgi:hypothetical protein